MSKKYVISTGGRKYEIIVNEDGTVLADGKEFRASLSQLDQKTYSLLIDENTCLASIDRRDQDDGATGPSSYLVTMRGKVHLVDVDDERSILLRSLGETSAKHHGSTTVRAPMPGLVVKIEVGPGDTVTPGQGLIVLEAMKMENEIRAAAGGVIKEIHVQPGKPVEKDEPLLSIEA